MAEESYGFSQARVRLEEIVTQVRKKDVSLEKSLDLLEEGVRLANQCTELIDHADWEAAAAPVSAEEGDDAEAAEEIEASDAAASETDGANDEQTADEALADSPEDAGDEPAEAPDTD